MKKHLRDECKKPMKKGGYCGKNMSDGGMMKESMSDKDMQMMKPKKMAAGGVGKVRKGVY